MIHDPLDPAQFTWVIFLFAGKTIADWWETYDFDETAALEAGSA